MRPTKLTMSAFGPYADVTTVDFDKLGATGVYLVCGDTGAGKTMIFDAICFALFGEASGDARGGARSTSSMRSDYAQGSIKTYVELSFNYRGKSYRIRRNPEYERAKERGEGTTRQKPDAEMELPDGRNVSGVRNVNAQVEELLGIDCEQFKQIVMLAQGEFRKLLTADTETRQIIFRKLFGTERYELVQELLSAESHKLETKNAKIKSKIATLEQQARLPQREDEDAEGLGQAARQVQAGRTLQDRLEAALADDVPHHKRLDEEVESLRGQWSEAHALLKQVEKRPILQKERQELADQISTLKARAPELAAAVEEQRAHDPERTKLSERAAVIEGAYPKYDEMGAARKSLAESQRELDEAKKRQAKALDSRNRCAVAASKLASEIEDLAGAEVRTVQAQSAFDAAAVQAEAASKALEDAENLAKLAAKAEAADARLKEERKRLDARQSISDAARKALQEAQTAHDALADADALFAQAEGAHRDAIRKLESARSLESQRTTLADSAQKALKPYEDSLERFREAEQKHDADQAQLHDLQKRQRAGRAGLLAADLTEGTPCPVCGSTHHPNLAATGRSIPSDAEIDDAANREKASAQHASALAREAEGLKVVLDERTSRLAEFDEAHGGPEDVRQAVVEAESSQVQAKQALETASARKEQRAQTEVALKAATSAYDEAARKLDAATASHQAARESFIAADKAAQTLRESLGAQDLKTAQASYAKAQKLQKEAQSALDHARGQAKELAEKRAAAKAASEDAARAEESLAAAKESWQKAAVAESAERARVNRLASDLEFESIESAKREVAHLRDSAARLKAAREAAEKEAADNASKLATKEELLKAKEKQIADIPAADAAEVQEQMDSFHSRADELKAEASQIKTRIDANQSCLDTLKDALAEAGDIEQRYGRVKLLADAATGNLVGQAKIRFEAYVQAIYFDKVIAAANERLKLLTSGQFELVRYSQGSGNAKAGLGLYVIDSFTGRARDASSLSGGESFQASLCLALGLSDIVQAHAGGIEFDTMFVDEGFGSLDQGALGNAISLLSDLSGGTKLVGIISHVEDLKANIPKKIVVTKTRSGSSVAVEL